MARIDALTKSGSTASARALGSGPTLLVVPAGGSDDSSWDAVTANLRSDFEVVRILRPKSVPGADAAGHSMAEQVADVLAIAAVLQPPILLVGQSSGAAAALEAALAIPWEFAGILTYAIDPLENGIESYGTLALPITLVEGELSSTQQHRRVADLAQALPNAQVVALPGQEDQAHLEAPDLLAEVIRGVANRLLR